MYDNINLVKFDISINVSSYFYAHRRNILEKLYSMMKFNRHVTVFLEILVSGCEQDQYVSCYEKIHSTELENKAEISN